MNDQNLLVVFIAGTILITAFAVMMTVFLVIHKQRQNRAKLERQQLEFTYNSTLLKTRIEMQEQALEFVSQEIHDNVGQVLSFSCMQLANIRNGLKEPESKSQLTDSLEVIRGAVKNLRQLSHSLNTGLIEKRNLEEAIETELGRIRSFSPIKCTLETEGHAIDVSSEKRLLVFRIVQEALQNVIKHSGAQSVVITLTYGVDNLRLSIQDDGKGIDLKTLQGSNSLGMSNMSQRANLLKGDLKVDSDGHSFTNLILNIPL